MVLLPPMQWTEARLTDEGWHFNYVTRHQDCNEEIALYTNRHGKKLWLEEGTLEVHSCPRQHSQ